MDYRIIVATNFLTLYFLVTLRLVVPKRTTQANRAIGHFARTRIYERHILQPWK